jgi:DHA1 family multidrug resistance protein-like MFS transporter
MSRWKRNLIVLCFAQLVTLMGFSTYFPFIPYFIQELGVTTEAATMSWVAVFNSGAAVSMAVFAPIWGTLADRYGRKMMVLRATIAAAILVGLMGVVQTPLHLIILRILQGAFCGTVAASTTLIASETPEDNLAMSLGFMQTAQFAGQSIGPLVGGVLADTMGYRPVFTISAILMACSAMAIALLIVETRRPPVTERKPLRIAWPFRRGVRQDRAKRKPFRLALSLRRVKLGGVVEGNTLTLILALASNAFALATLAPILSLYIQALNPDTTYLGTVAGAVSSISALTSSLAAMVIGRLADRTGQKRILTICLVGIAVIHIPQAFVSTPLQLLVLRGVQGIFMGGIMPSANALLARSVSQERRGTVFGFSTSAQSVGRALGPTVGAAVAGIWGMSTTFWVPAIVFGLIAWMLSIYVPADHPKPSTSSEEATRPA